VINYYGGKICETAMTENNIASQLSEEALKQIKEKNQGGL